MKQYLANFKTNRYGGIIFEAKNAKEAKEIADEIANFRHNAIHLIDWDEIGSWEEPLEVIGVHFYSEVKEKPEQTDEEWFNQWQAEIYEERYS